MPVNYVKVNGTKLAYIEQGEGQPVVFLHGGLCDLRTWSEQQNLVSRHYKSITYSRRYHQPNEWTGDGSDYSMIQHVDDFITFLEALNLKNVHLVGRCLGASIALLAALRHPEMIRSLVLGEPSLFVNLVDEEDSTLLAKQKVQFNEAVQLARRDKKEWAVRQFLNVSVGADVLDQMPNIYRRMLLENANTLEPMLETFYDTPGVSCEKLKRLNVPALLVSGEFSPKLSRLSNEKLSACLPDSESVILRGTSHGLHLENSKGFSDVLLNFLLHH